MTNLDLLRAANPHIPIYSVNDKEFSRYGKVIKTDTDELCEIVRSSVEYPETGSRYNAAYEPLDSSEAAAKFRAVFCGELDEEMGLCWGHSNRLNALEWHTCNEFNIAVRELVLLLAKRSDMDEENRLDSAKVKAFCLGNGEMIEVFADTLHFCPCEVTENGFACIAALQRGTNLPLEGEKKPGQLLWMKNKWLIAHEENAAMLEKGAFPGIYGENIVINRI